ncbi:MAG: hypothetical protein R3C26_11020 [Calditrichia bacterium]
MSSVHAPSRWMPDEFPAVSDVAVGAKSRAQPCQHRWCYRNG